MTPVRIGCGAGFAGDRFEPAVDLMRRGRLDFLVLECLAERTIAAAHRRLLSSGGPGFDPYLRRRLLPLLTARGSSGTRIVTNMGAADPLGAGHDLASAAAQSGTPVEVAVVTGDDVLSSVDPTAPAWEDGVALEDHGPIVAANAYLGADAVLPALDTGAAVVVTGRVADPSLFVAPLLAAHGWSLDDAEAVGRATLIGHLLECGAQVTGGYFADPPRKIVHGLTDLGFPLAVMEADGTAEVTKLPGTGGRVDAEVVREQLLYEVEDPSAYVTPDVVADFTGVRVREVGPDRVRLCGARGRSRPRQLKVSVGYLAGHRCEAEISYAGTGCVGRARLAGQVVQQRLAGAVGALRFDVIGVDSLFSQPADDAGPSECRLRVSGMDRNREVALRVGEEVTALYTNGPAGGAGVRVSIEEQIGIISTGIDRHAVTSGVVLIGSDRG